MRKQKQIMDTKKYPHKDCDGDRERHSRNFRHVKRCLTVLIAITITVLLMSVVFFVAQKNGYGCTLLILASVLIGLDGLLYLLARRNSIELQNTKFNADVSIEEIKEKRKQRLMSKDKENKANVYKKTFPEVMSGDGASEEFKQLDDIMFFNMLGD